MINTNSCCVSMVRSFEVIDEVRENGFPGNSKITIKLEDQRSKTIGIENYKIHVLIQSIAREKIKNIWWKDENNFDEFGSLPQSLQFFLGKTEFPTADEIISEIFSQNIN